MPAKQRHSVLSLGSISGTAESIEVDVSCADTLTLYASRDNSTSPGTSDGLIVQSNPAPFGETGTWHNYGVVARFGTPDYSTGKKIALVPQSTWLGSADNDAGNVTNTATRIRLKGEGANSSYTDIYLEMWRAVG